MSWDYIQICALCSEIYVILFYTKFLFDCKLQSTQQTDLSCSTRCPLTHFQPSGSMQTLCYCPAAECTQPTDIPHGHACQKSHPGWAGDTTCARATCQAQHGAWKGLWDGTNASVPQHTFHWGWRGCQGLQQVCSRAMKAKIPWLFVTMTKLARARNVHTAALTARGRSQEAGPAICVYRGSVTSRYMDSHLQDLMGHLQLQLCLTSSNYSDSLTFSCNSVQRGTLWMGASQAGEVAESMRSTQPS